MIDALVELLGSTRAKPGRQGVLITGGSGFLGYGLVEKLLADGCPRICIYSRGEFRQAEMRAHFRDNERLRWFIGDVRDERRLERAMQSVYTVIHAAALKRIEVGAYNPEEMVKTNVDGTVNVVEAARRTDVGKVLFVSSDKAYEPKSPYGQSKAMAESIILNANDPQYGPRFGVVRYGNVAGSTGSVIPTWRAALARAEKVKATDPRCTRFWMTRERAAAFVVDTLVAMAGGELAIPDLPAFELADLLAAMDIPEERIDWVGLPVHEKLHESMSEERCSAAAERASTAQLREWLRELP